MSPHTCGFLNSTKVAHDNKTDVKYNVSMYVICKGKHIYHHNLHVRTKKKYVLSKMNLQLQYFFFVFYFIF